MNVALMHRIDQIYTKFPYYGSPKIPAQLKRDGYRVNHKRIERLMRVMGIQAIYPKPDTSKRHSDHTIYPYLLRKMAITHPNQVWGADITYVRADSTWFYLVAILDWYSRYVMAWRLSRSLTSQFCITALKQALNTAQPHIHNSDQGSQFTSHEYLNALGQHKDIRISMDGRGRCFDNIFNERLWRTVKYEEVYLKDYSSYQEANESLTHYFTSYNTERLHQSLNYQTPAEIYFS